MVLTRALVSMFVTDALLAARWQRSGATRAAITLITRCQRLVGPTLPGTNARLKVI